MKEKGRFSLGQSYVAPKAECILVEIQGMIMLGSDVMTGDATEEVVVLGGSWVDEPNP